MHRRQFLQLGAAGAAAAQPARRLPNFVVLFADDMGYGDLGCYGHPTIRTPNLDSMAAQGMRFTSCYAAAPFCTPSRVGLLTGRYPVRAGQPNNLGPDSVGGLPLKETLLPRLLKDRGYKTAAIGKWHLGHNPASYLPTSRGFDSYYGLLYSNDMIRPWVRTEKPLDLYRNTDIVEQHPVNQETLTERYTDEAVKFIRNAGDSPFFLYVPYAMPHLPIRASAKFRGTSRAGLYGDVIETLDWSAGEILKTLAAQGIDRDTMVVFASDNGPWLGLPQRMLQEGNERWHAGFKSLLRGWKGNTYEGGIRVPCMARWPGVIPQGQTGSDIASTLDIFMTIARAAGANLPDDRTYDGVDLMPHLRGQSPSARDHFFYFRSNFLEGMREGPWKLRFARHDRQDLKDTDALTPELFHLDRDPAEQFNVYDREKSTGDRLLNRLRAFATELKAQVPA